MRKGENELIPVPEPTLLAADSDDLFLNSSSVPTLELPPVYPAPSDSREQSLPLSKGWVPFGAQVLVEAREPREARYVHWMA
jgi:hypothetical protein